MIGTTLLPEMTDTLLTKYATASPFPHVAVDGWWGDAEELRAATRELLDVNALRPDSGWEVNDHSAQQRKYWCSDPRALPETAARVLRQLNAKPTVEWLSELTGLRLIADPTYLGGGVHRVYPGGRLAIHADFNLHPKFQWHRRVNVLLYLNEEWDAPWGGHLELWDAAMSRCVRSVAPFFNRAVIFNITDTAFHGHPAPLSCPEDRSRLSFATYYYTMDRPLAEQAPFHWAAWQQRPNGEV